MSRIATMVTVLAPFLLAANTAAQPFVPDLPAGSTYHLAFVTDGKRDASSDQISDYDAFVNDDADKNGDLAGINWLALASTPTVDAVDHVPVSGPIYRLDGELIATGQADLWNGPINAPIGVTPLGNVLGDELVWTGSDRNGIEKTKDECSWGLGSPLCAGVSIAEYGLASVATNSAWIDTSGFFVLGASQRLDQRLYAVSEPLVVPEPSGLALLFLGTGAYLAGRRRWHSRGHSKATVSTSSKLHN